MLIILCRHIFCTFGNVLYFMMKYTNSINRTSVNMSLHKIVKCLVYWYMAVINVYRYFITVFLLDFVIAITLYIHINKYIYIRTYIRRRIAILMYLHDTSLLISSATLIEITNKMKPCNRIYYSNGS
jgi:hypothetical protein